ncbi:peroxiredoxin family protein, partial [Marinilabilia salmonicolor]
MKSIFILISFLLFSAGGYAQKFERKAEDAEGLSVGEKVESFSASDQKGNTFRLDQALEEGPVVLIFYRGHWCPVCNRQLGKLEAELPRITEAGGTVVAVSPEKPDYIEKTIEKTGASYTLLYDKDYQISNAFDVTYLPGGLTRTAYSLALGSDFNDAYDDDKPKL